MSRRQRRRFRTERASLFPTIHRATSSLSLAAAIPARRNRLMDGRRFVVCLVAAASVAACEVGVQVPDRLPPIPETAVWAGGVDGGAWIECSLDKERAANWCTTWSDQTGTVTSRTYFVLRENGEAVPESELKYSGFDGVWVWLTDGRALEPLKFHGDEERDLWEHTPIDPPRYQQDSDQSVDDGAGSEQ